MKVYLIVEIDSYDFEHIIHKCFLSREIEVIEDDK